MHQTEKDILNNLLRKQSVVIFTCPSCNTWYIKAKVNQSNRLKCLVCTATKEYIFCGHCSRDRQNGNKCGNPGCFFVNYDKQQILLTCPVKLIDGASCPSVRACPNCQIVTEYVDGCIQMWCTYCSSYFCFLCLDLAKTKRELKCKPYNSDCQRAPRQILQNPTQK